VDPVSGELKDPVVIQVMGDRIARIIPDGVSVLEVLRSATVNAAQKFGLENETGTIAPGRAADIIAVDGDPLRDVQAFSRVVFVMQKGRSVRKQ
jgi:imidazolonepropionase-like amidohydrolase